jgi:4-hydroxy-tetrahydrodipicolinate reductase
MTDSHGGDRVRVGVFGCDGRMGGIMVRQVTITPGCMLVAASVRAGSYHAGRDAGLLAGYEPIGIIVTEDERALVAASDVVIDFTSPESAPRHIEIAAELGKPIITGTTGLNKDQQARVVAAARKTAVVQSANMSVAINLMVAVAEKMASVLGPAFDAEILGMHHRHKPDAPSGTALALGHAIATAHGNKLEDVMITGREGMVGDRPRGQIGIMSLRGGDLVGANTVYFLGDGERLELTHRSTNRQVYAVGAMRAAQWIIGKPPGLYGMHEVLGI